MKPTSSRPSLASSDAVGSVMPTVASTVAVCGVLAATLPWPLTTSLSSLLMASVHDEDACLKVLSSGYQVTMSAWMVPASLGAPPKLASVRSM